MMKVSTSARPGMKEDTASLIAQVLRHFNKLRIGTSIERVGCVIPQPGPHHTGITSLRKLFSFFIEITNYRNVLFDLSQSNIA